MDSSRATGSSLLIRNELTKISYHISTALGFRAAVLDRSFREIAPGEKVTICPYCALVQTRLRRLDRCRRNDAAQSRAAESTGQPVVYTCHAGLTEAVFPLQSGNRTIAFVLVGQYRTSEDVPAELLAGISPESAAEIRAAYRQAPRFESERMRSALNLVEIATRYLVDHRIIQAREYGVANDVVAYLSDRIDQILTLADVAQGVGKSTSRVNQTLRAALGTTFKPLFTGMKMDRAAQLLLEDPMVGVAEVALQVGVEDPFYFSRMFKRRFGLSPRAYRSQHQWVDT